MFNLNLKKWNLQQKLIGLIVLAFCLCWFLHSDTIEKFMDGDFSKKCPNRLLFDGQKYYLLNTDLPLSKTNPVIYNSLEDYQKNQPKECPILKPLIKAEEPVLPLQHKCNRKNAFEDAQYNDCSHKIYTRFNKQECEKVLKENQILDNHANLAIDRCMMDQIIKNDTQLNPFRNYHQAKHSKF